MKNKNFTIFLLSLIACSAILVFANEDQHTAKVPNSSPKSSPDGLPKVIHILQIHTAVKNGTTEEISEPVNKTSLPKNEVAEGQSTTTETTEDLNQNVTTESSVLPKRHAVTSVPEDYYEGENMFDDQSYVAPLTLEQMDNYSCFDEASTFGHKEAVGVLLHETICEFRKLWHYILVAFHNLKTEFKVELPIETEETIILVTDFLMSDTLLNTIEQGIVQLEILLENPEHLNNFLDTVEKCIPMSHIHETASRLRVAFANFFIHLQGFVIYFEPHQTVENYIEILKKFEDTLCAMTKNILKLFNIHLETEASLLTEFFSLIRSLMKRFSFEQGSEQNLSIFKEFIETLHNIYKEHHASESSGPLHNKVAAAISTFVSKLHPQDLNVTIVHIVLPDHKVATVSCNLQVTNDTSSSSQLTPSHHNLTSLCKDHLSDIFEKEVQLISDLLEPVKLLFKKLSSGQEFEHHLTALKEFIDSILDICKKFHDTECSEPIVDKVGQFVSTVLLKSFNVPLFHFKLSNESSAALTCDWQVANENSTTSSSAPKLNIPSFFAEETIVDRTENRTQGMTLSKLIIPENSMPISMNDLSDLLSTIDDALDHLPTSSEISVPSSAESNPKQLPSEATLPEETTNPSPLPEPVSVNNNVPSSAANAQPDDESVPEPVASQNPEIISSRPDSSSTQTATSSVPTNCLPQDEQQPPVSPSSKNINSEKPADSLTNNQPIVSPASQKPAELPVKNPPVVPASSQEPADLPVKNPPVAPVSSQELAELPVKNPSIAPASPEKPADVSVNTPPVASPSPKPAEVPNSPIVSPAPEEPVNPPVPSSTAGKPIIPFPLPERSPSFPSINPLIPSYASGRPIYFSGNNPSIYPPLPETPTDFPANSPPLYLFPPVKPADFSSRDPLIPSYFPERPLEYNSPPVFPSLPEGPIEFLGNGQPVFPYLPERPSDLSMNNPAVFLPSPDFSDNSRSTFLPYPERPANFLDRNQPVFSPVEKSPSVLFPGNYGRTDENSYDEYANSYVPPSYLIPASDIVSNLPHYSPFPKTFANNLESADAFYKSLYSYLQYGNPAVAPPPSVSNKISEFLRRGFLPSLMTMDDPNICGTAAFLPSLSALNNILKNIRSSQFPLHIPRKEIASALGNVVLLPGDLIVILPNNDVGLIGRIMDTFSPIYFKVYEISMSFVGPQDGVQVWHLRSGDVRNPECKQQLELLFQP